MKDREIFFQLVQAAERTWPGFKLAYKDESRLMRIIGRLLFFSPLFMHQVTTTLGRTVYFPSRAFIESDRLYGGYKNAWKTLAHELVHVADAKAFGVVFYLLYATPQVFAIFAVVAVWASSWWLLWLLALLPLPSPGRTWLELRGYTMSMAVNQWRHGAVSDETRMWIREIFTGSVYYWMWPFRGNIAKRLEAYEGMMRRGADPSPAFGVVREVLGAKH